MHHTFLYISFPFLPDYDVKMPNFAFMGDINKQQRNFVSLSELGSTVIWNSASGGFVYIWWSKWVRIIAMKTEKTQIHFLSDVLVAVVSLNLEVPNIRWRPRYETALKVENTLDPRPRLFPLPPIPHCVWPLSELVVNSIDCQKLPSLNR